MSESVVLQVEGMSCTSCEQRVGNALRRVDGVAGATADHVTGRVDVELYDGGPASSVLAATITRAGYRVVPSVVDAGDGAGAE